MTTEHSIVAPTKDNVTRWVYDPSKNLGGRFFDGKTGTWRDRGLEKYNTVVTLTAVDQDGKTQWQTAQIWAPADGYVRGLPTEMCYFTPGEEIAILTEGYVYHWEFFGHKSDLFGRKKAVLYHRQPRVQNVVHLFIAIAIGLLGHALNQTGIDPLKVVGILAQFVAVPYGLLSASFAIFGQKRTNDYLETFLTRVIGRYPHVIYGGLSLLYLSSAFSNWQSGAWFQMFLLGLMGLIFGEVSLQIACGRKPFTQKLVDRVMRKFLKPDASDEHTSST